MVMYQHYEVTYRLDKLPYRAAMHIEQLHTPEGIRYKAIIDDSPLHGTFGGEADTVELALDFLNLAMQAEGADEISFTSIPMEAAG